MQKNQIWFILGLVFAMIVTIFALTNAKAVVIHLFFYEVQASQALVIFFSAAMGAIMVVLLGITQHFKLKSDIRKLKKERDQLIGKNEEQSKQLETLETKLLSAPSESERSENP